MKQERVSRQEIESLHPLEKRILVSMVPQVDITESDLQKKSDLDEGQLRRALGWLKTKEYITITSEVMQSVVSLTDKGEIMATSGTPEMRIVTTIRSSGPVPMQDVRNWSEYDPDDISKAIGKLKKSGIIDIENGLIRLADESPLSTFSDIDDFIRSLAGGTSRSYDGLDASLQETVQAGFRKRGKAKGTFWIDDQVIRQFRLTEQGAAITDYLKMNDVPLEEISQLTTAHLKNQSWRGKLFRRYNITLPSPHVTVGRKHPYREFLDSLKTKLISMGFEEMRGSLVENEFWNMDALFMPQFHSARDIHDIYFVKSPTHAKKIEEPFDSRVKQCHENGWETGSTGWGYHFSEENSKRLVLRSQGTVLSARTLANRPNIPGKYFAIARCFRYDHIDATHAPDFYQVEGIVLGNHINFRHLLGLLKLFAVEVARAKEVKFLPAYFPFTEPSVEVHIKHEKLGWIEMGGAGLFRPEVTRPLGVDVPVIAWGLGIDRMAMVALGIHDIRDLFSTDLDKIRATIYPF